MGRWTTLALLMIVTSMCLAAQSFTIDPTTVDVTVTRLDTTISQHLRVRNNTDVATWTTVRMRETPSACTLAPSGQVWMPAGTWVQIDLTCRPSSWGTITDQVQVIANAAIVATSNVTISTQRPAVRITATPTSIDHGNVAVGRGDTMQVTLTLSGTPQTDVVLSRIDAADHAFGLGPDVRLRAGTPTIVPVIFAPRSIGVQTGTLVISHADTIIRIPLRGTGTTPPLPVATFDVDSLELSTNVGSSIVETITLRNTGTGTLRGTAELLDGRAMRVNVRGFSLPPNGSQQFEVTYTPNDDLDVADAVRFDFDDISDVTIPCRGTARIVPAYEALPNVVDFGEGQVGETLTAEVRIENRSRRPVSLTLQFRDGTACSLPNGPDVTLAPLEIARIPIACSTDVASAVVDALTITDGTSETVIQVTALIVDESAIISTDPDRIDFDEVAFGSTAQASFVLQNGGRRSAAVALRLDPADADLFTIDLTSMIMEPGDRDTITLAFNAARIGTFEAAVVVEVDGVDRLQVATSALVRRPTFAVAGALLDATANTGDTTSMDLVLIVSDTAAMSEITSVRVALDANVRVIAPVGDVAADVVGTSRRRWSLDMPWPGGAPGDTVRLPLSMLVALGDAVDDTVRLDTLDLLDASGFRLPIAADIDSTGRMIVADIWMAGGRPRLVTSPSGTGIRALHPIPAGDVLHVDFDRMMEASSVVHVRDLSGRALASTVITDACRSISIPTHDLIPGTYLVQCASSTAIMVKQ